jgi:uncharacterized protein (DUF2237 family)
MTDANPSPKYELRRCEHCGARKQMKPGQRFCRILCKARWHNAEKKRLAEWAKKHHPDHRESA